MDMEKNKRPIDIPTVTPPDQMDPSVIPENEQAKMKKEEADKLSRTPLKKPYLNNPPGSRKRQDKDINDPNPDSDPNYGFFPNIPYPTGPE